ncbi:OAM dimerization domain-containing protein [Micromonospora sp. NPDC051296]|uniref:lysine 5,6-aminomutase subunit beta n=1 Tax=Micromonospora sp. NPDC051296 TaxID=3155046 RepID=UPI0034259C88
MRDPVNLAAVRPYADALDDGFISLAFTLPVPDTKAARRAALKLASEMGLQRAEVVHQARVTDGFTYFLVYARCPHTVDYAALDYDGTDPRFLTKSEVEQYADKHLGRTVVVVGASTGTDTHTVGIDAMLNLKGFDGQYGLEAYRNFRVINLGSQVPNEELVAKAIEVGADAILVSQTVTQQDLHVHNLTELVELVDAEGLRERMVLVCGGPRISPELAKELGFDAGFSKGTYPNHVATFVAQELVARRHGSRVAAAPVGLLHATG